jgi:hypothetical protein
MVGWKVKNVLNQERTTTNSLSSGERAGGEGEGMIRSLSAPVSLLGSPVSDLMTPTVNAGPKGAV